MANPPLILIVDDSQIQCKVYANLLKAGGYRVVVGTGGRDGVALALQHHPDLILMDILMPEMDGLSATRALRTYPETAQIPILALTATTDPGDFEKASQAGYNDVVDKGGDRALVLEKVRQWLP